MPVDVTIEGEGGGSPEEVVEIVLGLATELARDELEAIWPVGPRRPDRPHSYTLFRAAGFQVINDAPYSQYVHYKGDPTLIIDVTAPRVAEEAVDQAIRATEAELGDTLDAAVYDILRETLGR